MRRALFGLPEGLRGPAWAWYGAGFLAIAFAAFSLHLIKPPAPGLEPAQLVKRVHPPDAGVAKGSAPTALDLSASTWRGGLDLHARRPASEIYGAVALIDSRDQLWLVQRGDRQDPACLPDCDRLKLRVNLDQLAPGPFRVAVALASQPIPFLAFQDWLPLAGTQPPLGMGASEFAVRRIER